MTRPRHYIPKSRQREKPRAGYHAIGKSMRRVEDPRLLTGNGQYADDVTLPNMAHAAVGQSPDQELDLLADFVEQYVDLKSIDAIIELGIPKSGS